MASHGIIHLLGFARAWFRFPAKGLTQPISKLTGIFWLLAAALFIAACVLFGLQKEWWWMASAPAICLSQYVIIKSWHDAKFGTIGNIILLAATSAAFGIWFFNKELRGKNSSGISRPAKVVTSIISIRYENK